MKSLLLCTIAAVACCGGEPAKAGEKCESPSDCAGTLDCDRDGLCRPHYAGLGDKCENGTEGCYRGLYCKADVCAERLKNGAPCSADDKCEVGLDCFEDICTTYAEQRKKRALAKRLAQEKRMLLEAGVDAPAVEHEPQEVRPRAPGNPVRVVKILANGYAVAACKSTERLTGGSCVGPELVSDEPTKHGDTDTVGARWVCRSAQKSARITAVALCERIPD